MESSPDFWISNDKALTHFVNDHQVLTMSFSQLLIFVLFRLIISHHTFVTADCVDTSPKPFRIPLANCTIAPSLNFPSGVESWGVKLSIAGQQLCAVPSLVRLVLILVCGSL